MKNMTVPNLITLLRICLVPFLIYLVYKVNTSVFLLVLGVSLLSDVLDGYVARLMNLTSDLGAKLDSVADTLTYCVMIFALYQLWKDHFIEQAMFIYLAISCYFVTTLISAFKFGELPSYHTLGAKVAALLLAPSYYLMVLFDAEFFFRSVIIFYILVAFEELIITFMLKRPEKNIGSVFSLFRRI